MQPTKHNFFAGLLLVIMGILWIGNGLYQPQLSLWLRIIIAFLFVLTPGGLIVVILIKQVDWLRFIIYGLPVSIGLIGLIGVISRFLHLSMNEISLIWFIVAVICVIWLMWHRHITTNFTLPERNPIVIIGVLSSLVVMLIFAYWAIISFQRFSDILIYNAEVTYFASHASLDWQEIYFNTGNSISDRFYFSYWTLFQALMVHISGTHILQLQYVLSAILIIMLGLSVYGLGRDVGFSPQLSLSILVVTFICYKVLTQDIFQPGIILITRNLHDKQVGQFVLFPIVMAIMFRYLQSRARNWAVLLVLVLVGMFFTHPIATGLTVLVICGWMFLSMLTTRTVRPFIYLILMGIAAMIPLILLRLLTNSESIYDFGDNPVSYGFTLWVSDDKSLYAPTVSSTGLLTYIILMIAGVVSLIRIRSSQYRLALSISIVIGIGLFPYTAWFYGRLISTQHIWRNIWIIPYGFMVLLIASAVGQFASMILARVHIPDTKLKYAISPALAVLFLGAPFVVIFGFSDQPLDIDANQWVHQHDDLIEIVSYIDEQHDERVDVLGDKGVTSLMPTLSYYTRTFMFFSARRMFAFSLLDITEAQDREDRQKRFYVDMLPIEQIDTLDRYGVDYLLYDADNNRTIDDLMDRFSSQFEVIIQRGKYILLRYTP